MQKLYREKDDEFSKRWTDLKSQISEIQEKIIREKNGENAEMSPENYDFKMQVKNLSQILKSLHEQHEIEK